MSTPPSPPSAASRVAFAVEQLHIAIDLFLSGRSHASALTLAGAAEVVLAQQAERFGSRPSLERQYEVVAKLLSHSKHRVPSDKAFYKERNALRNQLKHFDPKEPEWLDGNVAEGAIQMLGRACNNYELCGLPPTEKMQEFYGWYYSQIVEPPDDGITPPSSGHAPASRSMPLMSNVRRPRMPSYSWSCLICDASNPPGSEVCGSCSSPASVSGKEIAARKAALHAEPTARPPMRNPPTGHSFGTWAIVVLFALGALQGFWYLIVGVAVPANAPTAAQEYVANIGLWEKVWRFAGALTSLWIAWLLFRLKRLALTILWAYIGATSAVLLAQLAFSEASRAFWFALGWWPLLVSVALWAIPVVYLHRVRAQGRLAA